MTKNFPVMADENSLTTIVLKEGKGEDSPPSKVSSVNQRREAQAIVIHTEPSLLI